MSDPNITTVILSAYWNFRVSKNTPDPKGFKDSADFKNELIKTVNALVAVNKTVFIADDVPNFLFYFIPKSHKDTIT